MCVAVEIKSSLFFPALFLPDSTLFHKRAADIIFSGSEDLNITKESRHRNIKTVDSN